jgi:DNA repair protein RadD
VSPTLYPHQEKLKADTRAALGRVKSVLLQGATGIGKSQMAISIIFDAIKKDSTVWFVAPRKELIKQIANTMDSWGIFYTYIAAGKPYNPYSKVQIVSLQTIGKRLGKVPDPDLVIIDEVHYGGAMLDRLVNWIRQRGAYIICLSASPWRLSGEGLGKYCDEMALGPSIRWLMDNKYLSDYRLFAPSTPDLSGIRITAGDYAKDQLSDFMEHGKELIGDAVGHYKKIANGKLNITFCVSIKHSEMTAQAFREAGIPAAHMDGETTDAERTRIIQAFARREILCLTNCALLTFGFDLSSAAGMDVTVESISDLAPTKSLALQLQKWGRALRKKPETAIIMDHAGNAAEHGLPDDERKWSLDDREKRRGGSGERTMPVRQCPTCFLCFKPAPVCPGCNYRFPVDYRTIKEIEGELQELKRVEEAKAEADAAIEAKKKRMEVGMAKTIDDLKRIAEERGYQRGWVYKMAATKKIYT